MAKTFKDYLKEAEMTPEKYHCKDCGDTMYKPTTDCSHDSHDENGRHWIDDNGNGIHDMDEDVPAVKQNKPLQKKLDTLYGPKKDSEEHEVEFEFTGDDGEMAYGELYYKVIDGQVDPKSLRGETDESDPKFGNHKVDSDFATYMVQPGGGDHEGALAYAQDDYDEKQGGNEELDRIKALAGASIDETYDDDDDFYNAYGEMWYNDDDDPMDEAEYQGRKVKLGKPMAGDVKKFKVYVKDPKTGNVKKVNFGHGGSSVKGKSMRIRKNNPGARKSFRARHNCDNPGPRTKARYWSCRKW